MQHICQNVCRLAQAKYRQKLKVRLACQASSPFWAQAQRLLTPSTHSLQLHPELHMDRGMLTTGFLQEQAKGVQSKIDAIQSRLQAATCAKDSKRDQNTKLNNRLGVATAALLQLERQSSSSISKTMHSNRLVPSSAGMQHPQPGHTSDETDLSGQRHHGHYYIYGTPQPEPSELSEQQLLAPFDPLMPLYPTFQRPPHTFAQQRPMHPEEAVPDVINVNRPADDCSADAAYSSKKLRDQDISACEHYCQCFGASIDAYLAASSAPVKSCEVCWYMQTPWYVAQGQRLCYSTSISSISCCCSLLMTLLGTLLESAFTVKVIEQRCGNKVPVECTLFDKGHQKGIFDNITRESMDVIEVLDKVVACATVAAPGVSGGHFQLLRCLVLNHFHIVQF